SIGCDPTQSRISAKKPRDAFLFVALCNFKALNSLPQLNRSIVIVDRKFSRVNRVLHVGASNVIMHRAFLISAFLSCRIPSSCHFFAFNASPARTLIWTADLIPANLPRRRTYGRQNRINPHLSRRSGAPGDRCQENPGPLSHPPDHWWRRPRSCSRPSYNSTRSAAGVYSFSPAASLSRVEFHVVERFPIKS